MRGVLLPSRLSNRTLQHGLAALVFGILSLFAAAPALLSSLPRVCAADAPDTWMHLWIFWRTRFALAGGDRSYFVSHLMTYPGYLREPMAVFDPLLPLLSVPLQSVFSGLPTAFNLLTCAGLFLTAFSAYLLCRAVTGHAAAGGVGAVVAAFNPFVQRQICGGYIEYAWWGLLPFTLWLLMRACRRFSASRAFAFALSCVLTFLTSLYLGALLIVAVAVLSLAAVMSVPTGKRSVPLRTLTRIHGRALAALALLFTFWGYQFAQFGFRTPAWGVPFPIRDIVHTDRHEPPQTSARPARLSLGGLSAADSNAFLVLRTLHGSVDLYDLSPASVFDSRPAEQTPASGMPAFERVRLTEWILVLVLAALSARGIGFRGRWPWLFLGLCGLVTACGPYVVWRGDVFPSMPLPYALFYRFVPGFPRLVVPGRAFLLTVLGLSVLAARGADQCARIVRPRARTARVASLAVMLYLWFAVSGPALPFLPATHRPVPAVYGRLRDETGRFALLELPLRGDLPFRIYCQTVHRRPVFRGPAPDFMTPVHGEEDLQANRLVHREALAEPLASPAYGGRHEGFCK